VYHTAGASTRDLAIQDPAQIGEKTAPDDVLHEVFE
jgi:hypothetical protein